MKSKSILNLGLRGLSLAARFLLSIFMVNFLSLSDIGLFGLIVAVTSVSPAVFGFGVNYFLNRTISSESPSVANQRIKERLILSFSVGTVVAVFAVFFGLAYTHLKVITIILLSLIFIIEMCLMDLHFSLVSVKKAVIANGLLFFRSALWVYPFMLVAWLFPVYRNFDSILYFWLAGQLLAIPFVLRNLKGDPVRGMNATLASVFNGRNGWRMVYMSDVGLAVMAFADRFILGSVLELKDFGVYIFYATIANSVYLLLTAAVTQMALPDMLAEGRKKPSNDMLVVLKENYAKVISYGIPVSGLIFLATIILVAFMEKSEMRGSEILFAILIGSALIRVASDLAGQGMYAGGQDIAWAYVNLFGALLFIIVGLPLASFFGASGMAFGGLLAMCIVLYIRHKIVKINSKQLNASSE
jgi:O-antigen/teichoic acid export membrane protein